MAQNFIKNQEDFICEHCVTAVRGNGYTNHCSKCLWSKHVDINPGDRASRCGGLMKPQEFIMKEGYSIMHRCAVCEHEKKNKVSPDDNFEELLKLSKNSSVDF